MILVVHIMAVSETKGPRLRGSPNAAGSYQGFANRMFWVFEIVGVWGLDPRCGLSGWNACVALVWRCGV